MKSVARANCLEMSKAPGDVWAVASDLSRFEQWRDNHSDWPEGVPTLELGAAFTEKLSMMGIVADAAWKVTEVSAPRSWAMSAKGPMGLTLGLRLDLAAAGDGTMATLESSATGSVLIGPMVGRAEKAMEDSNTASLTALRDLLT